MKDHSSRDIQLVSSHMKGTDCYFSDKKDLNNAYCCLLFWVWFGFQFQVHSYINLTVTKLKIC